MAAVRADIRNSPMTAGEFSLNVADRTVEGVIEANPVPPAVGAEQPKRQQERHLCASPEVAVSACTCACTSSSYYS